MISDIERHPEIISIRWICWIWKELNSNEANPYNQLVARARLEGLYYGLSVGSPVFDDIRTLEFMAGDPTL